MNKKNYRGNQIDANTVRLNIKWAAGNSSPLILYQNKLLSPYTH
jgi:hypothetical protein